MIKKPYSNVFIALSLFLWAVLFALQFIQFQKANRISYFAAEIEFIIHLITLSFSVLAYRKASITNKSILFWLLISVAGVFLNDTIFYQIIYSPNNYIARLSSLHFLLNMLPFFSWVIATIVFFYKILKITFKSKDFYKILSIFLILNATIVFLCFSSIPYAASLAVWQCILQLIGYISESIIFDLAILCLIYSKNKDLSWIAAGFAILISGDFFLTYTHLTQTDNTLGMHGELFWFLGLLFILFGIYDIKHNINNRKNWLKKVHSIKHIFAFWTFRISLLSLLPALILAYFFLPIDKGIFLLLPSLLIVYSIMLVVLSLFIGRHLEIPFKQFERNIDALILKKDKAQVNAQFSIEEFIFLQKFLNHVVLTEEKNDHAKKALIDTAIQVAHDMRSPLAAINTVLSNVTSIPENQRTLIKNAAKRINDIANNLLSQSKNNLGDCKNNKENNGELPELIFVVLDSIVAEKRYEYYKTNININFNVLNYSYNCFSNINLDSFKRILSNLINNSIEAVNSNGSIDISLNCNVSHIQIIIEDNGCGIPADILPRVTEQRFSFNKENGSGFGLSYTKQYLDQINGTMHIQSEERTGTKITISLIRANYPDWFCHSMNIKNSSIVLVLDDDPSIHDAWDERFTTIPHVKLVHSYSVSELLEHKIASEIPILYLVDYELLADVQNGLDVIEELKLNNAILVTSCFEDLSIRARSNNLGVKIIPKPYVPYIQIIQVPIIEHQSSLVFIDDDEMMRTIWKFAAEKAGKSIATYSTFDEFVNELNQYSKNIPIYIDSELGNNVRGEICAKYLFDKGYFEIHLATGHLREQFHNMPWIKTIVGKEPPFYTRGGNT